MNTESYKRLKTALGSEGVLALCAYVARKTGFGKRDSSTLKHSRAFLDKNAPEHALDTLAALSAMGITDDQGVVHDLYARLDEYDSDIREELRRMERGND